MKKVFLGGTCNGSLWRERLIPLLHIGYFNPVVEEWTEECYLRELKEREECDFCLYVITPKMTGAYSIAEVVDDSNKRPEKVLFCYLTEDGGESFDSFQVKSLSKVAKMVQNNGGKCFHSLNEIAEFMNSAKNQFPFQNIQTTRLTLFSVGFFCKKKIVIV